MHRAARWCVAIGMALRLSTLAPWARAQEPAAGRAIPARLRLDQALALLRAQGLDLLIAQAEVRGAEAELRAARGLRNPVLSLSAGRSLGYHPPCSGCSADYYSASIADQALLTDLLAGKRGLRIDAAAAGLEATRMARADTERILIGAVKQAYAHVVVAQTARLFAQETQLTTQRALDLVQVRYNAGAVSEADVARATTAVLQADQQLVLADEALRSTKIALAFLLGVRGPLPSFEVDPSALRLEPMPPLHTIASLLLQATNARPDLQAARHQVRRAQSNVALTRRQLFPDLELTVQYTQQGTSASAIQPPTLIAGLSAPLPLLYQYQGQIGRARAELAARQLGQERVRAQIAADVQSAFVAFESARNRVQRMRGQLLNSARKGRDLVMVQYEKGAASLLEMLDAQRTLIAIHAAYLQDLTDYWTSLFQLEQAIGRELTP